MAKHYRNLIWSVLIGGALAAIPYFAYKLPGTTPAQDRFQQYTSVFLFPGAFASILPGGNIHDANLTFVSLVDLIVWSAGAFGLLAITDKFKRQE